MSLATADHFNMPQERSALPVSFAAALLLEGLCLLAIVGWLTQHPVKDGTPQATMQISLVTVPPASDPPADPPPVVAEEPPPPEIPPPPPPEPEVPVARPTPKPQPPQVHRNPPRKPVERAPQQQEASAAPSAGAVSSFQGQLRRAVENALVYPASARASGQHGRARVTFDYADGHVSGVSLAQSTGSALLDQAALATVRNAHYPLPPPELSHQTLHLSVFVEFKAEP